jgi:hypothetical protein
MSAVASYEKKESEMSDHQSSAPTPPPDPEKIVRIESAAYISQDLADFGTPGVWVEVDPETAEQMGAFEETAVSFEDTEDDDGN